MRFLFLNQFYPPDPAPTGRYLHDVASRLVEKGHAVRVVCSRRAYGTDEDLGEGGVVDGVEVRRVRGLPLSSRSLAGRAAEHLAYFSQAVLAALGSPRPDLILAATSPPFVGLAGALANRGRGLVHAEWIMDAYPDVLAAHWSLPSQGWAVRGLDAIARFQMKRAALVLTLGGYMADRVGRRMPDRSRLHTVPLWTDLEPCGEAEAAWRSRRGWSAADVVFLYSGNMGRGHRFDEFLEAARRLGRQGPVWAFVGGGPRRGEVERFRREHPEARVETLPYVAAEDVGASHRSADVHLVSLSNRWQGLIVPSKLQAAFSAGRPVIFVGPEENEMAAWIRESGGGWVVGEGDVDGLVRAVQAAHDPRERAERGRAGLEYARVHFDRERNRERIADILERGATAARLV